MQGEYDDMVEDKVWKLMAKKLSNEATKEELKELDDILNKNSALANSCNLITEFWNYMKFPIPEGSREALNAHLKRMNDE